ncbi:MAG TPA: flagellar basal body rod protein FlgB [Bacteroidota bacterium]|nr:flagellar basal body rod protein FlgB [Bacteroidota bacterium]
MKLFDSTTIPLLSKALNAYTLRQKTTSANIANIDTVGYRAQAVTFQEELQSASQPLTVQLSTTEKNHIVPSESSGEGVSVVDAASAGGSTNDPNASGVNNVDIDHEMSEMAETQYRFKYAARMMTETFRAIEKSIRGQSTT